MTQVIFLLDYLHWLYAHEDRNHQQKEGSHGWNHSGSGQGGMLEPLETLNLPEGKEVTVTTLDVPSARDVDAFRRSAGGWKGTIDADELIKNIYADRLISTRPEPHL